MTYILQTHLLSKVFDESTAVSEVNLNVKKGEIYGFLGPNGAGKTTIIRMLVNLIKPSHGDIEIFGEKLSPDSYEVLKKIGCIIEYPVFYDKLTARENLELHCEYVGFYDKHAIDSVLELVQLKHAESKAVKHFSLGMKQRLGVARAMITKPEILILDEPTNGLDPVGIKEFRNLFQMLSRDYGMTLLISSHVLGEIEQIADTIGVINEGRLIQEVSMETIKKENKQYIEVITEDVKKAVFVINQSLNISNFKLVDDKTIRIYETNISQGELSKALILEDVFIEEIHSKNDTLEDYFLKLINGGKLHA